jgi:hypothetical protein
MLRAAAARRIKELRSELKHNKNNNNNNRVVY